MGTLVAMKGITKTFPGVCALNKIDLDLNEGEVHLLLGENGAGKSTLMKILSGVYEPTEGTICIGDETFTSLTPQLSRQKGISIIYQELSVVNELKIVENLFMGKLHVKKYCKCIPVVDWAKMMGQAKQVLEKIGFHKDAMTRVSELSISEKQLVEIAKALLDNSKILIMDEPTSSLSQEETKNLFKIMKELKAEGVGIIYISHKMDEIREIGDRVTILKDGELVKTMDMADVTDNEQIISLMVGRKLSRETMRRNDGTDLRKAEVVLRVSHVVNEEHTVEDVSFELHRGEILGFAGLVGAGRTELMNVIFGAEKMESGEVWLYGEKVQIKSPYGAIKNGMAFITENRRETGFFDNFDICRNVASVKILKATKAGGITGMIHKQEEKQLAMEQKENLSIHCTDIRQPVVTLSGGNQQKVIVGKWLASEADIMIFDEPTRGIDIGAKNEIYHIMRNLADQGKSILMVSSELPELLRMCDRILVFNKGHIRGEFSGEEATEQMIMSSAIS